MVHACAPRCKRDVYLPTNIPRPSLQNSNQQHIELNDFSMPDSQNPVLVSKRMENDKMAIDTKANLGNSVVWKQMGTAKGKGRLYKGGRWLKDIEVNMLTKHIIFCKTAVVKFSTKQNC